jgi:serine/threonine protein phosphatase PrpC
MEHMQWQSSALSHQGNVRDHNEDSCLDNGARGLWVVADGMGGHDHGDYASQLIVERLQHVPPADRPSEFIDSVENTLMEVNQHLYDKSMQGEEPSVIGSTVVALLAFDRYCVTAWVGDSRAYVLHKGRLAQVSRDHSEVQSLVDQGLVRAEDAESHPKANVITRAVGGAEYLYVDFELREIAGGDRYLLCSDGLFKDINEDEIADYLGRGDCEEAAASLLELALSRTCNDNVTVVVVDFLDEPDEGITNIAPVAATGAQARPDGD